MGWEAVAGAAAPIVGGIIGDQLSQGDKKRALDAQKAALAAIQGVPLSEYDTSLPETPVYEMPDDINYQQYQSAGELTPQQIATVNLGPSEMGNVYVDPRLKEAQLQSLRTMQELGQSGGMTMADKAQLAGIQAQSAGEQRGAREALLQNMRQRGVSGSGLELAAMLEGQQGAANQASMQGLNVAGMAQQRALEAMQGAGQLGGQMSAQDFQQQSDVAAAKDAISRFNAQNSQQVGTQNTGILNNAQAANLAARQSLMNQNTGLSNEQMLKNIDIANNRNQVRGDQYQASFAPIAYKNDLKSQTFGQGMQKATGVAGQQQALGNAYANKAQQTAQMFSGIGQGVGQGAAAYGQSNNAQAQQDWQTKQNELDRKAYGTK
jgi:hypothetical protein